MSAATPSHRASTGERINTSETTGHLTKALGERGIRLTRQRRVILQVMDDAELRVGRDEGIVVADAAIDAEVIEMLMTFFAKLELAGTTLYINSIGHDGPDCRRSAAAKRNTTSRSRRTRYWT